MSEYTVIIDHVPYSIDRANRYIQAVREGFLDATEIVVASDPPEEWAEYNEIDFRTWATSVDIRLPDSDVTSWSALNYAVSQVSTEFVVILEEDWWPSPRIGQTAIRELSQNGNVVIHFERRDTAAEEIDRIIDGKTARSTPRALENPGYAIALPRKVFLQLRGYDERPKYERAAGVDLMSRLTRAGYIHIPLDPALGAVYHAPDSTKVTDQDGPKGVASRREISDFVASDKSIYRNLIHWSVPGELRPPLVTVAVATKDRGSMISDSLNSILYQTFQDFEVIVVDDGSEDTEAELVVKGLNDPRFRYVKQEASGISAARNRAADLSTGYLTAVHDDDDIMLPDRLERGISALTSGTDASYGSWINFSDTTGEMRPFLGKLEFGAEINAFNGQGPGHSTWTLPTWIVQRVRYDDRLSASVDHNLASRLDWIGVRWTHTEEFMYLRRVHENQVTATDGSGQKIGHTLTRYGNNLLSSRAQKKAMMDAGKAKRYPVSASHESLYEKYSGFLPDGLVRRSVRISRDITNAQFAADMPDKMTFCIEDRNLITKRAHLEAATIDDITLSDLAAFRQAGLLGLQITGVVRAAQETDESGWAESLPAEDATSEDQAIEETSKATGSAALARAEEIIEGYLRKYPTGSVLVEDWAEPYHELVEDSLLVGALLARRIVASGEFGIRRCLRVYGYAHRQFGLTQLEMATRNSVASKFALHTQDSIGAFIPATRSVTPDID